jgi:hypothetical protein
MDTRRTFHPRTVSIVLVLVLSILGFLPQLAHASTYVGFTGANITGSSPCGNGGGGLCFTCQAESGLGAKCGTGSVIKAPLTGTITAVSLFTSGNVVPNQLEVATFPLGQVPATTSTGPPCFQAGQICVSVNGGQSFTVQDVEGISGLTPFTFSTIALANPVSISQNQYASIQFTITGGSASALVVACATGCNAVIQSSVWDSCIDFGTISPLIGTAYPEASVANCPGVAIATGATFTATGASGGIVTVTQCYGNCGTPAVTLATTNSTHGINFNQSLTLFYEFQSNVNGFVLNVTTNVQKQYSNGQTVVIGVYVIPSCSIGTTPFSSSCPGLLQFSRSIQNPVKGQQSLVMTGGSVPVSNGQWIGVAVSGLYSPLDLNDTNTNVNIFQTNGLMPAVIQTASQLVSCACKTGLWAFIVGNVVTGVPPTGITLPQCAGFLDCLLPNWVASLCFSPTSGCITSSALVWVMILSIFTSFFVWKGASNIMPGVRLPIGETFLFFALIWIFVEAGLGLLPVFALIFLFFVVSLMTAKHFGGKFL